VESDAPSDLRLSTYDLTSLTVICEGLSDSIFPPSLSDVISCPCCADGVLHCIPLLDLPGSIDHIPSLGGLCIDDLSGLEIPELVLILGFDPIQKDGLKEGVIEGLSPLTSCLINSSVSNGQHPDSEVRRLMTRIFMRISVRETLRCSLTPGPSELMVSDAFETNMR